MKSEIEESKFDLDKLSGGPRNHLGEKDDSSVSGKSGSDSKESGMRETRVQSLGLEKEMTTHSSIVIWKIPWTEEPGRLQPIGLLRVGHDLSD